jgi:hypothetical protein
MLGATGREQIEQKYSSYPPPSCPKRNRNTRGDSTGPACIRLMRSPVIASPPLLQRTGLVSAACPLLCPPLRENRPHTCWRPPLRAREVLEVWKFRILLVFLVLLPGCSSASVAAAEEWRDGIQWGVVRIFVIVGSHSQRLGDMGGPRPQEESPVLISACHSSRN